jgi:hypothetical protein
MPYICVDDIDDEPCMGEEFDEQLRKAAPGSVLHYTTTFAGCTNYSILPPTVDYSLTPRRHVAAAKEAAGHVAEAYAKLDVVVAKLQDAEDAAKVAKKRAKAAQKRAKAAQKKADAALQASIAAKKEAEAAVEVCVEADNKAFAARKRLVHKK